MTTRGSIPTEPIGTPTYLRQGYEVYVDKSDSRLPETVRVVERPRDIYLRLWTFQGGEEAMHFESYVEHPTGPDADLGDDKADSSPLMRVAAGHDETPSHPNIEDILSATDCPDSVATVVATITDAPVLSASHELASPEAQTENL